MYLDYPLSTYTYDRYSDKLMNELRTIKFDVIKGISKVYPTRCIRIEVPDNISPEQTFNLGGILGRFEKMIESHQI